MEQLKNLVNQANNYKIDLELITELRRHMSSTGPSTALFDAFIAIVLREETYIPWFRIREEYILDYFTALNSVDSFIILAERKIRDAEVLFFGGKVIPRQPSNPINTPITAPVSVSNVSTNLKSKQNNK